MGLLHPLTCLVTTFLRSILELGFFLSVVMSRLQNEHAHALVPEMLQLQELNSKLFNSQTQLCPSRKLPYHALLENCSDLQQKSRYFK